MTRQNATTPRGLGSTDAALPENRQEISPLPPRQSTYGACDDLNRLGHSLRDSLHLPASALCAELHRYNDRQPAPLSCWFVDSLGDAISVEP